MSRDFIYSKIHFNHFTYIHKQVKKKILKKINTYSISMFQTSAYKFLLENKAYIAEANKQDHLHVI